MTDTTTELNINRAWMDDEAAQSAGAEREPQVPGRFYLRFAPTLPSVTVIERGGFTNVELALPQTQIVADEQAEPLPSSMFKLISRFYKVSTFAKGNPPRADLDDLLTLMGAEPRNLKTVEDFNATVVQFIAGQTTPEAIRMTYTGQVTWPAPGGKRLYKHPISGKGVYLKAKDFKKSDGSYARAAYYVNGTVTTEPSFPDTIGERDFKAQQAHADAENWGFSWSNFEPDFNAFAPGKK